MSGRIAWALLAIVTLGGAGVIAWEEGERARLAGELGRSRKQQIEMKESLDDLEKRLDSLETELASEAHPAAPATGAAGPHTGGSAASDASPGAGEASAPKDLFAAVMESGFLDQVQKQMVEQELAQIARAVKLTPREREDLEKLLLERTKQGQEMARRLMNGEKVDPRDSTGTLADSEREIERILGTARYQDYQAAKARELDEQKETAFRSQFSFFARDVGLRDDQLARIETIMRKGGFGTLGTFVPEPDEAQDWAKDLGQSGEVTTKTMMSKMVEQRRKQLEAVSAELRGVLNAEQLAKLDAWRQTQESQLRLMEAMVPDLAVPVQPTPQVHR